MLLSQWPSGALLYLRLIIESGKYRDVGENHGWIYYSFPERDDNMVCAAVVDGEAIIIKTIMIQWHVR